MRTLPPLVSIGVTLIRGTCPRCHGLLAEASALAGVRMIAHIPPLAGVGVMASIGAGLSWRAVWAAGIQGGCICQPFLLNFIFENLGAYGGLSGPQGSRMGHGCTCQPFILNSIFENLGAYGGPSGLQGSRTAVPASSSSSTPSLRIWGLMEDHLGHGDPGRLYLPAVPPQLHLCENLGAYGGLSGLRGSRTAIPASCASSTPSLRIWGLMKGATIIHWNAAAALSPARHHGSTRRPMGGGACGGGDMSKDAYHFFV